MKIIFKSKNIFIDKEKISSYHCILLCLKKLKISPLKINNFYLSSKENIPLKNSDFLSKNKSYNLNYRLKGSSGLYRMGNSLVITILGGILFGFLSIFYYGKYLNKIVVVIPEKLKTQLIENFYAKKGGGIREKFDESLSKTKSKLQDFGKFLKFYCIDPLKDDKFSLCLCNQYQTCPEIVLKKQQKSPGAILSFIIFATYIFMLLMPLITNAATTISCKKPGFSKLIIPFIFIFLPLVIMIVIPHITKGIDLLISKIKKQEINLVQNFNLAVSNLFLIILMFIYLGFNKKGISPIMWGMIPISLILFSIIKIFPIDNIFSKISIFISNKITNTTEVPKNQINCNIKLSNNKIPNSTEEPQECWLRYSVIFDILQTILMSFLGFGLTTAVYAAQVRKNCEL